jgi:hypothetical protein
VVVYGFKEDWRDQKHVTVSIPDAFLSFTPKTPLSGEGFVVFVLRCGGWTDGGKVSIYVKHILCTLPAFRYAVLHRHVLHDRSGLRE